MEVNRAATIQRGIGQSGIGVIFILMFVFAPQKWEGLNPLFVLWGLDSFYQAWRTLTRTTDDEYTRQIEYTAQSIAVKVAAVVGSALYWVLQPGSYGSTLGLGMVIAAVSIPIVGKLISWFRLSR